mgnify:CR=1 FL=1
MKDNQQHHESETQETVNGQEEAAPTVGNELTQDETATATTTETEASAENAESQKLAEELADMKDKYLRLMAEFENAKRRNAREREELRQTASKDVLQSLLVILDDMDRATQQMDSATDLEAVKEGTMLVFNKLRSVLLQKGLKKMDCLHLDFDADLHEAITEIPAGDEKMSGKVLDVVEPGYYLNDKLIRHAKVVVGK